MKDMQTAERDRLRNRRYLVSYLQEQLRKGPGAFRLALRNAVQSQEGGFAAVSRRAGLTRTGLYKALSEPGNPSYSTICQVLDALGLTSTIMPKTSLPRKRTMAKETETDMPVDSGQRGGPQNTRIQPGSAKGLIYIADDFDAPLPEFAEYV